MPCNTQDKQPDDEYTLEITEFPVALNFGQRILVNGKAVATVHETHLCPDRETLLRYIEQHKDKE